MVALSDLPTLICVRMTAVNTVHRAIGRFKRCETARLSTAAVVIRRHSRNSAPRSRGGCRSHLQVVAICLMPVLPTKTMSSGGTPDAILSRVPHEGVPATEAPRAPAPRAFATGAKRWHRIEARRVAADQ